MSIELPTNVPPVEGEVVVSRRWANRNQHKARAVGGRFYVTNLRIVFCPHAVDAALAGEYWWTPLSEVTDVGKEKRNLRQIYSGGLRTRLKITLVDGSAELFVVNKLDAVIDEIRTAANLP
ncbi:hypothetical protein [Saccharopolyspora griseoalba]|uniref:GRAM domain-containing protein n=1 Tax=Saccharopolyspora griseoalba TaxID=1431848 RepID=A0ABW2LNQ7_9PSEU